MKSPLKLLSLILLSLLPATLFAQGQGLDSLPTQVGKLGGVIDIFNSRVVASVGVLLLSLAIVTFFAGMVRFIWSMRAGDGESAKTGRRFMLWGLLAVFVIFSVYGIVYFFQRTLGINGTVNIPKPCLNFVTDCKSGAGTGLTPVRPSLGGGGGGGQPAPLCNQNNLNSPCMANSKSGSCDWDPSGEVYYCNTLQSASAVCSQATLDRPCLTPNGASGTCDWDPQGEVYYCNGGGSGGGTTGTPLGTTACTAIRGSISEEDGKCYTGATGSDCFRGCDISSNGSVLAPGGGSSGGPSGGTSGTACSDIYDVGKACSFGDSAGMCALNDESGDGFCDVRAGGNGGGWDSAKTTRGGRTLYTCRNQGDLDKACRHSSGSIGFCKYVNADNAITGDFEGLFCDIDFIR